VPFRFTPNMQNFVTPIGIEGLLTSGIMAIGRGLTEPAVGFLSLTIASQHILTPMMLQYDLEQQLSLFLRDEVFAWYTTAQSGMLPHDLSFRRSVQHNAETLVKKADLIACRTPTDTVSAVTLDFKLPQTQWGFSEWLFSSGSDPEHHRLDYSCRPGTTACSDGDHLLTLDVIQKCFFVFKCTFTLDIFLLLVAYHCTADSLSNRFFNSQIICLSQQL
jgi:hypothetical protein